MKLPKIAISQSFVLLLVAAIMAALPAVVVKYPPIQDLPFHTAATRVIHDYSNPAFGFEEHFVTTLGSTQYVFYYLCTSFLSYFVGVSKANIAMLIFYLSGTVFGLRSLVVALGKDDRLALLVLPILVNMMFMFGLLPFLIGIPILFFALATLVRQIERPTMVNGVVLALLGFVLFYCHVFPFALFCVGYALMFPYLRIEQYLKVGLPAVPAALAALRWVFFTEAGKLTSGVVSDNGNDGGVNVTRALPDTFRWLTNVFSTERDDAVLVAFGILVLVCTGFSQGEADHSKRSARMFGLLPISCVIFYFILPQGHGYIWLISQRFPILFLMTLIPTLRLPKGNWGHIVSAGALAIGAVSIGDTCDNFRKFRRNEVGDFDGALREIPPKQKVAALIFDKGSSVVNGDLLVPFLHFGSYYQAEKGGVLQFTYAGYKHWPFTFKPGKFPPPGGPARLRWEWTPEQISVEQELAPYYDYVLVRGNNNFHPPDTLFRKKWSGNRWEVWENTRR